MCVCFNYCTLCTISTIIIIIIIIIGLIGLASRWLRVTDSAVYPVPTCVFNGLRKGDEHPAYAAVKYKRHFALLLLGVRYLGGMGHITTTNNSLDALRRISEEFL